MRASDPRVRASRICIACGSEKSIGLLLCWPCHAAQKRAHDGGYDPKLDELFDMVDADTIDCETARVIYRRGTSHT